MLSAFHVGDLFPALYERHDVLLIADQAIVPLLQTLGRERYGVHLRFPVKRRLEAFAVRRGVRLP